MRTKLGSHCDKYFVNGKIPVVFINGVLLWFQACGRFLPSKLGMAMVTCLSWWHRVQVPGGTSEWRLSEHSQCALPMLPFPWLFLERGDTTKFPDGLSWRWTRNKLCFRSLWGLGLCSYIISLPILTEVHRPPWVLLAIVLSDLRLKPTRAYGKGTVASCI